MLKTIKALADANRLRIIRLLMDRPRCVCELQKALAITQPSVSNHLRILEEAGLVNKKRSGQFIEYYLVPPNDHTDQQAALMGHLIPWLQIDPELAAFSEQVTNIDRQDLCSSDGKRAAEMAQPKAL